MSGAGRRDEPTSSSPPRVARAWGGGSASRSPILALGGLLCACGLAAALLLYPRGDDGLIGLPELQVGQIAPRTVKSPRGFSAVDPVATARSRKISRGGVPPIYDRLLEPRYEPPFGDPERRAELHARVGAPARAVLDRMATDEGLQASAREVLEALRARPMVGGSVPELMVVRTVDPEGRVVEETSLDGNRVLRQDAIPQTALALTSSLAGSWPAAVQLGLAELVGANVGPNLVPNPSETRRRRRWAEESTPPSVVVVARGDRILRAGERITSRELVLLRTLEVLESPRARIRTLLGSGLLGLLLAWLGHRAARFARGRHGLRDAVFLACCFVGFLCLAFVGFKLVEWLASAEGLEVGLLRAFLPVTAMTILVRVVAGPAVALVSAPVAGLLAGLLMDESLAFAAYTTVGALAAVSGRRTGSRSILAAGLRASLAQGVVSIGILLIAGPVGPVVLVSRVFAAAVSGLLSAGLARITLPAIEALFGYTTPTGLAALADPEHPLMRELLVEVPGTYHRGQHVGTLADAGARAVGSDRLLARVGGYLHDVGALGGPGSPTERRARAVTLAHEQRFPPELSAILAEQPLGELAVTTSALPRSKTAALVFLAHRIEASLAGCEGMLADRASVAARVRSESRSALAQGYLDKAALEMRELAAVELAFTDTLEGRFVATDAVSWPRSRPAAPPS